MLRVTAAAIPSTDGKEVGSRLALQAAALETDNSDPLGLGRIDPRQLTLVIILQKSTAYTNRVNTERLQMHSMCTCSYTSNCNTCVPLSQSDVQLFFYGCRFGWMRRRRPGKAGTLGWAPFHFHASHDTECQGKCIKSVHWYSQGGCVAAEAETGIMVCRRVAAGGRNGENPTRRRLQWPLLHGSGIS